MWDEKRGASYRLQKLLVKLDVTGGEGGIRTLPRPVDSVSYRFHIAADATIARNAVAPCTLSHAGSVGIACIDPPVQLSRWTLGKRRVRVPVVSSERPEFLRSGVLRHVS